MYRNSSIKMHNKIRSVKSSVNCKMTKAAYKHEKGLSH